MRGKKLPALASLFCCLFLTSQTTRAEHTALCIPHFADGFDGQSIWQTELFLDGRPIGAEQSVISVFSPQGLFLRRVSLSELFLGGGFFRRDSFPFFGPISLLGRSSFQQLLSRPLQTGFLIVESPGPLNLTALIRRFSLSGNLISELVISPFDPFHRATLVVQGMQARLLAFALANTDTLKRASGRFDFFPLDSELPLFSFPFDIGPRSQFLSFLFDLFPQLASSGLRGFVRISSDTPISLMAVSLDGNAMQQVPVVVEE